MLVAVLALLVAVFAAVAAVGAALGARQTALTTADAAALAGADVALGLAAGIPCDTAATVTRANGADLARCDQRGDLVRVRVLVATPFGPVTGTALAGPPPTDSALAAAAGGVVPAVYGVP